MFERWQDFLSEEKIKVTAREAAHELDKFANNTWIFFDTETTGLSPHTDQLTEVAAIAVSPEGWKEPPEIMGQYHDKIKLTDPIVQRLNDPDSPERAEWEKFQHGKRGRLRTPQQVLSLTRYGSRGRTYLEEQKVIDNFINFVEQYPEPVLVAQNASFDMKFLSVRSERPIPRYPVFDTLPFIKHKLIPTMRTIKNSHPNETARTRAKMFLDNIFVPRGKFSFYSASMGPLSKAYGISADDWHNALADVKMLMKLFKKIVDTLHYAEDLDIRDRMEKAIGKSRRMDRWRRKRKEE